jgi:hypothetical protein
MHEGWLLVLLVWGLSGCAHPRLALSPDIKALYPYGLGTVPVEPDRLNFHHAPMDDDDFARAFRYIKNYGPKQLHLNNRQVTDLSVSLLIQLDSVEDLDLAYSPVSIGGLKRLRLMKNLKRLWVGAGQFTAVELAELRQAMPGVEVGVNLVRA